MRHSRTVLKLLILLIIALTLALFGGLLYRFAYPDLRKSLD